MFTRIALVLLVAANCAPRELVAERLTSRFQEHQVSAGLLQDGNIIEVWRSEDGATWTLIVTRPDGVSCVMAAGTHWLDGPIAAPMGMKV